MFDQPSVKDAAAHIHSLLEGRSQPAHPFLPLSPAPKESSSTSGIYLSIIARLPCQFSPLNQSEGISTVPYKRWDTEGLSRQGKAVTRPRFGGWLKGVEQFDSNLFGVSAPEAELMDPQQRLLLEAAWEVSQVIAFQTSMCLLMGRMRPHTSSKNY